MTPPIVLFVYNRVFHTRRTVESLLGNPASSKSDLIIYSDGPKTCDNFDDVQKVRDYISSLRGFKSVKIFLSEINKGLAESIIYGVTDVLTDYESVIVLEDDMVVSPHFLSFMDDGLQKYHHEDKVISIHGYVYPVKEDLPETFFLRGADCWGWATWRRGWKYFNPDGKFLFKELKRRKLFHSFDFNGAFPYSKMLKYQIKGKNDSWAIRWFASAFLSNKLTLYPGCSLVHNIGNDRSGTHCRASNHFDTKLSITPLELGDITVEESTVAKKAIECFFRSKDSFFFRSSLSRIKKICFNQLCSFAKDLLSFILRQKSTLGKKNIFDGPFSSWAEASKLSSGYDNSHILEKVLQSTLKVKNGEAVYERDSVLFDTIQYSWPITTGLMWTASLSGGRLSVLDFGGALGSNYFQNLKFLETLKEVYWSVVEQPHFVTAGRQFVEDKRLVFYSSIKECVEEAKPNVVLLSSVLQYLQEPFAKIDEICKIDADVILIDMTIVNSRNVDGIFIQNVPKSIYEASYPVCSLSEKHLIRSIQNYGYKKIADFESLNFPHLVKLKSEFKGFIFAKTNNE